MNQNIMTTSSAESAQSHSSNCVLGATAMLDNKKALTGKNLPEMTKFENEAKVNTWFSKVYHQVFEKNG